MLLTPSGGATFSVALPDEQATCRLMVDIANALEPGDFVTLSGDLGAGKTTFARALIRYLAGDETIEVPSPTFTLMQTYELPRFPLVHADLYRVAGVGRARRAPASTICCPKAPIVLLEWPDRAGRPAAARSARHRVHRSPPSSKLEFRHARVTRLRHLRAARVERISAVRGFIAESGLSDAKRQRLPGDASMRSYERLTLADRHLILMNWPSRPEGPPVRDGKSYGAIAHLADSVVAFVALAKGLRERSLPAPEIFDADLDQGLILIEDFGDQRVVEGDPPAPVEARYEVAVDALLALHAQALPAVLPVAPHLEYRIPAYDMDAFLIEAELLLDWYLPSHDAAVARRTPRARRSGRCGASCCKAPSRRRRPGCCATIIRPI